MTNWWDKPEIHDEYERRYRQLIIVPAVRPEPELPPPCQLDPEAFIPKREKGAA
jgi:hypothetical protein